MALKIDQTVNYTYLHCKLLIILNIIFTHLLIKKTVLYTTRINLEKRKFHIRTSILLKIGGPLQLVVVLVFFWFFTFIVGGVFTLIPFCTVIEFVRKKKP